MQPVLLSDLTAAALAKIPPLGEGRHESLEDGCCIMEAASFIAGEPWSDHPACVCPVIGRFLRSWNDGLHEEDRDRLLRPLLPLVINTRADAAIESRRGLMALDWLIRDHLPAVLRLAGMSSHADTLSSSPEITGWAQCAQLLPMLQLIQEETGTQAAAEAWLSAQEAAAWWMVGAVRGAETAAAWAAAKAASDTSGVGKGAGAIGVYPHEPFQQSALSLVHRMIAAPVSP